MIARSGSGWQTVLADLALILFMVTAAVLVDSGEGSANLAPNEWGEPIAYFSQEGSGSPPIGQWLAQQPLDQHQQLTILVRYEEEGRNDALAQAHDLASGAARSGLPVRIIVEPGPTGASAVLAYDRP